MLIDNRQQENIATSVRRNELFDFLGDVVPHPNEQKGALRSEAPPLEISLASAVQQDQEADAATARTSAVIDQLLQSIQASQAPGQAGNFAAGECGDAGTVATTASASNPGGDFRVGGSGDVQGINRARPELMSAHAQSEPPEPPYKRRRAD